MCGMPEQSFNQQRWPSCRRWGPEMFCLISRSFYTQKRGPPALGLQRAHPGAAEQAGARRSSDFNQLGRWGQFFKWLKSPFWYSKNFWFMKMISEFQNLLKITAQLFAVKTEVTNLFEIQNHPKVLCTIKT